MKLEPVRFDGNTIVSSDYDAWFDYRDSYARGSDVNATGRRNSFPVVYDTAQGGWVLPLRIRRASGAAITSLTFNANVKTWFDMGKNRDGTRYLLVTGDDGTTQLRLPCYVTSIAPNGAGIDEYFITLYSAQPYFEANSATTTAGTPATNAGTTAALPSVAFTSAVHKTWRACTVSMPVGAVAYPVRFALNDAAATGANTFVYVGDRSVPTRVIDSGGASSAVWALVDIPNDGSNANVDIVYGSSLVNPLGNTLPEDGLDMTNSTNSIWQWTNFRISQFAAHCGIWRPTVSGNHNEDAGISYGLVSQGGTSVTFGIGAKGTYPNDADSMVLVIGSYADDAAAAMDHVRIVTTNMDGTNSRAFIRYRLANTENWIDAITPIRTNATTDVSPDVPLGVEVIMGIENDGGTADPATAQFAITSGTFWSLTIDAGYRPTVTVAAAANLDYYNGVYRIGAAGKPAITFNAFMVPDGTLTVDAAAGTITSSVAAAPMFGSFSYSDPINWLLVEPGANVVTNSTGGAYTASWLDGYN